MTKLNLTALLVAGALLCLGATLMGQSEDFKYQSSAELARSVKNLAGQNSKLCTLHELGNTPGKRAIQILQVGKNDALPGILVVANMEGNAPLASEAAFQLAEHLVDDWKEQLDGHTWYIMTLGNPDGSESFFAKPLVEDFRNATPYNDDKDEATDEDGPDDLNGDGFITTIRQKHPEGTWIEVASNPLLMREANTSKGEIGVYRLFDEGIDNDGDGRINEDGPGGTNPGRNFPHNFEHFTATGGPWSASEAESRALLRFAMDRPNICMTIVFGRSNSLIEVPSGSQRSAAGGKHKVPKRWSERLGVSPDDQFTLTEITEMGREAFEYPELTEDQVAQWMGLGAAVKPDNKDAKYWEEICKRYEEYLEEVELDEKRLEAPGFVNGSFDEWSYYQYGVPTFSMDFWTLPEPEKEEEETDDSTLSLDDLEEMSADDFIELGEEKIAAFLEANNSPKMYTAEMVMKALKGGMMTTKKMAKMMRERQDKDDDEEGGDEADEALFAFDSTAFVPWQEYDHPTLGKVEIGGAKPWATLAPPANLAQSLIDKQLPFVKELVGYLPKLAIEKTEIEQRNGDVWKINVWIKNSGRLPCPTHQGKRCGRPSPATVILNGGSLKFLEGREKKVVELLDGSGGVQKISWLVQAPVGSKLTVDLNNSATGADSRSITLKGGAR